MSTYTEIYIDQGATFNNTVYLMDDTSSSPLDLTDYTVINSKLKKSPSSTFIAGTIQCTVTNPLSGEIEISMSKENTTLLKPGRYIFEIGIQSSTGVVHRILEGTAFVSGTTN